MRREARHRGVEVHERDALDLGVLQDLADGEAVAAAEHGDAPRARRGRERGVHERLVVPVLVHGRELEVPVQEELEARPVSRHDDALVRRRLGDDDLVGVLVLLGDGREAIRDDEGARGGSP